MIWVEMRCLRPMSGAIGIGILVGSAAVGHRAIIGVSLDASSAPQRWLKTTLTKFYNAQSEDHTILLQESGLSLKFRSKFVPRGEQIWAKQHSEIMRS